MKILAALDISDESGKVLQMAATLAKQQGASLTLYTLAEDFKVYGDTLDTAGLSDRMLDTARQHLKKAGESARSMGVEAAVVAESGASPADGIVDYAAAKGMDLIVVGHRSKSGVERFLVGSVASKVVAHAPCSVYVVR